MASNTGNNGQFPANLPKLDGKNYDRWTLQMKVVFRYQDVVEVVKNGVATTGTDATIRDQQKKDAKALFLIHQCVNTEAFERIAEFETAKEAWDALAVAYAGDASLKKVKLQTLRREFELLQMEEKETFSEYFNRMTLISNQMRTNGEKLTDQQKIEKVLRTLTPKFDYVVTAIEQSKNLETMKVEELLGSLEANEARIRVRTGSKEKEKTVEKPVEQVLQAKYNKGNKNYAESSDKKAVTGTSDFQRRKEAWKNRGKKKRVNRKEIQCYNCDKFGHFADECKSKETQEQAHLADDTADQKKKLYSWQKQ